MGAQNLLLTTTWSLWGLALIATVIRIMVRRRIQHKFQAEDYFAVLAFFLLTGLTSVITVMAPLFGTEQDYLADLAVNPDALPPYPYDIMEDRLVMALKLMFSQMLLFWSTIWASKFSLLVFFHQLVVGLPRYIMAWWTVVALALLSYFGCMLSNFLTCVPLTSYWSVTGCSDSDNLHRSDVSIRVATALDIFADLLIMLLPLRHVWTLQISATQKMALACLFSLGMVVIAFTFVRLFNVTKATSEGAVDVSKLADAPLTLSLWTQVEASVSVIFANLPALRSFFRHRIGGPEYGSKDSGSSCGGSGAANKKMYPVYYGDPTNRSKSAFRHQSVELASLDCRDDDEWPITGKAAAMLGVNDGTMTMKNIEVGDTDILATTEIKVTRSLRTDQHIRSDSGGDGFGLQLRPDLN